MKQSPKTTNNILDSYPNKFKENWSNFFGINLAKMPLMDFLLDDF